MPQPNKYPGVCHACKKPVPAMAGLIEFTLRYRHGRRKNSYQVWCLPCFNHSDNSGPEDRCCGDRAYEDACARACGF